jgi:propionyl-CoA synthetase
MRGSTTVLYEGKPVGTPDPGQFWRMINQHKVQLGFFYSFLYLSHLLF